MDIEYTIMENTHQNALYVEKMRYHSYGVQNTESIDAEYLEDIKNGSILVFLCLVDKIPVSACYISNFKGNLFVDYLFTSIEYQRKQLYYGKGLLQYILDNKKIVEEYFNCKFEQSLLYPASNKIVSLYQSLGYTVADSKDIVMIKKI